MLTARKNSSTSDLNNMFSHLKNHTSLWEILTLTHSLKSKIIYHPPTASPPVSATSTLLLALTRVYRGCSSPQHSEAGSSSDS